MGPFSGSQLLALQQDETHLDVKAQTVYEFSKLFFFVFFFPFNISVLHVHWKAVFLTYSFQWETALRAGSVSAAQIAQHWKSKNISAHSHLSAVYLKQVCTDCSSSAKPQLGSLCSFLARVVQPELNVRNTTFFFSLLFALMLICISLSGVMGEYEPKIEVQFPEVVHVAKGSTVKLECFALGK